jgi:hypothetical protein
MKKKYMQPEVAMMEIELQQMIAASNEVTIDPTETGDPSEADSRFMEDLLGTPFGL